MNKVCYRTIDLPNPSSLKTYLSVGGYTVWHDIVNGKYTPKDIIKILQESNLRGRGGAGFPTGLKLSFLNRDIKGDKFLICNSDESEPGTCKDRDILLYNPHQVIEGILILSYALNTNYAINYMRGEFVKPKASIESALKEAYAENIIKKSYKNPELNVKIINHMGAGAYICGEETALLNSIEGKKGQPRFKPPFPAQFGLYGKPSNVNNTETIASVPVILQHGSAWFNDIAPGGTKIFSVSGHVVKPQNLELPLGTKVLDVIKMCGGLLPGRKLKAIIPGGSSMKVIPAHLVTKDLGLDYESIKNVGSGLGSGGMIVMDDSTCMVQALHNIAEFYAHESCGQCSPCREGTTWAKKILQRIVSGHGNASDAKVLMHIASNMQGRTICAFAEAAAWPIESFIQHFHKEFMYYAIHKQSLTQSKGSHD